VSDAALPESAFTSPSAASGVPAPTPVPAQAPRGPSTGPSPLAWLAIIAAVVGLGYLLSGLVIPIALAALLAYFLNPLVVWIQGFGFRRTVSVTALFAGFALLVVLLLTVVYPRFRAEILALWSNLPGLAQTLETGIDGLQAELVKAYPQSERFLPKEPRHAGWLFRLIEERLGDPSELLAHVGLIAFIVALTPIFAFFFLRDGGAIVAYLSDRLQPAHIETTVAVWCEIDRIIGRYLRGLALDALVIGALTTLGLWLIGAPYPWLLGAFTTLVNPLPYLGTILSVGVASIVAIANGQSLRQISWIVAVYVVIRILDDLAVAPVTIGGSVHMHPMLVLVSILVGEHTLGLLGMVAAVPLVTVMKETARLLLEHRRNLARPHVPVVGRIGRIPVYVC
jgi:predicted PurR-regulated permease PerM